MELPEHLYFYPRAIEAQALSTVFSGEVTAHSLDGPFTQPQQRADERKVRALCLPHQCGSIERAYITIPARLHANTIDALTDFFVEQGFEHVVQNNYLLTAERHGDEAKVFWNTSDTRAELIFSFFGFRGAPQRLYTAINAPQLEQRLYATIAATGKMPAALTERGYGYVQMPVGVTRIEPKNIIF